MAGVEEVGFDETVMASASRRRRRRFITAAVDADTGRVVDVFEGRDAAGWDRLQQALDAGDPYDEVADCWQAKEKVRAVFKTGGPDQAAARLHDAIDWCEAPEAAPELHRLARTLKSWQTEIQTSIATGAHNGRTEAANAKIEDIKRSARGFRNFNNYRLRILLATGQNPATLNPSQKSEPDVPASTRRAKPVRFPPAGPPPEPSPPWIRSKGRCS
ncbi:ISL3 family transposase [Candidatus Poriferisocius sp.]|uniref:ISL3 family transposase n=1 Tax=Candidatus Poriferisocius sp. TaxID=3101276 RepID=UPI003B5223C7